MSGFGNISEAAYLGVYSMILLARENKSLNATEIAEKLNASRHHVTKVMHLLHQSGYLESNRGPKGGYSLQKDPAKVSLLEIYELLSGKIEINACSFNRSGCPFAQCVFDDKINALKMEFRNYLNEKTVDHYAAQH